MTSRLGKILVVLVLLLTVTSGCQPSPQSNEYAASNHTGGEKKLIIVTSFYPLYISTLNVAREVEGIEVINMTKPQTGCLHDYQLTPEDLKTLEKADVFVVNGAGMETFIDKALKQQPDLKLIEASRGIALIKDNAGEENPHVWVSITDNIAQVRNIAEQLSIIDSAHGVQYKENADAYVQKLEQLKAEMHQGLDPIANKNIITFHEAFPYFAQEFNLKVVAVMEREPGTEPSPQELADTISTIRQTQVKALFAEPQYPTKAAETIARETGVKIYTLDPAVSGEDKIDAYLDIMEQNLKTLEEALQ
ncbi:MAG: metal ABC transporter substrate-binding protein [Syntrophomonadaceae bacterium]|nr:metal ABC transporter substrate-binding protein [Syntrophomonadaceae bacterium]